MSEKAIQELLATEIKTREELDIIKRKLSRKYKLGILKNSDILKIYFKNLDEGSIYRSPILEQLLRKRSVRTLSGIACIAVLTKPYPCPGECAYCPNEKGVPKSYISNEPAVMRAIRCDFHPYRQTQLRLRALEANGHEPTKIELVVIGGTWSVFTDRYKYWFITECFRAANDYEKTRSRAIKQIKKIRSSIKENSPLETLKKKLAEEHKKNEKAQYKIIGLTLETRPDYINKSEIRQMRALGTTRVEIGVQAIDNKILEKNKRGHGVKAIVEATKMLKDNGLKITYHIMPGLPGSTPEKDLFMFKKIFKNQDFQPDQIKFYPTVVTKGSLLYNWWKNGEYKPYADKVLEKLILACKKVVPEYVRVVRLIRDIPGESIEAGNIITNLRQILLDMGAKCRCIRCREVKGTQVEISKKDTELIIINYEASLGEEYFIQFTSENGNLLYGFCRLRLPAKKSKDICFDVLENAAIIRELHVYGMLVPIGNAKKIQHAGLGKRLIEEAERIASEHDYEKMAIISGVGVRGYYRKLGYRLRNTYMVKDL